MPVPKPRQDESEDEFKSRCISTLHDTDPDRPHEQIIAMCMDAWRNKDAHSLTFQTSVCRILMGREEHLATFYLMNTSENRMKWGVSRKALEEALPTLVGKPIGCGPGIVNDKHYKKPMTVGKWTSTEMPDGYALGTAEITNDDVWELLSSGEWGPVSVVIKSYRETCSLCGENITKDPHGHIHVKEGKAYVVVESFTFARVDFIDDPAYPQAGLMQLGAQGQHSCPIELVAGYYESQSIGGQNDMTATELDAHIAGLENLNVDVLGAFAKAPEETPWDLNRADYTLEQLKRASAVVTGSGDTKADCRLPHHKPDGTLVWRGVATAGAALSGARGGVKLSTADAAKAKAHLTPHYHAFDKKAPWESKGQAAGSPGGSPDPEEKRKMSEQKIEELKTQVTDLTTELTSVKAERDELKAKAGGEDPKVKELEAKVKAMEDEKHEALVETALEARFKAGLVGDRDKEREDLKTIPDSILVLMAADADKIHEKVSKIPVAPKTKYTKESTTELDAALNEKRASFGFKVRKAEGE